MCLRNIATRDHHHFFVPVVDDASRVDCKSKRKVKEDFARIFIDSCFCGFQSYKHCFFYKHVKWMEVITPCSVSNVIFLVLESQVWTKFRCQFEYLKPNQFKLSRAEFSGLFLKGPKRQLYTKQFFDRFSMNLRIQIHQMLFIEKQRKFHLFQSKNQISFGGHDGCN